MKSILTLLILLIAIFQPVWASTYKVGPVYTDGPGEISALVEVSPKDFPRASNFRLLLGNQLAATASNMDAFGQSGKGMALVVCVDASGSMGKTALSEIKGALSFWVGMTMDRPNDQIAILSFADDIRIESAFDNPRTHLLDAVMQIKARGSRTRLYDALNHSVDFLNRQDLPKRRRIIVISDGKDEGSTHSLEKATLKAKSLKVPIDVAGFGTIDRAFRQVLGGMSESIGGQFIEATFDKNNLRDGVARLYRDLLDDRSMMVHFSYEVANPAEKIESAALEIMRPGKNKLVAAIPGKYPMPKRVVPATAEPAAPEGQVAQAIKPEPPSPSPAQSHSWLVLNWHLLSICLVVWLILAAALFFLLRRKKENRNVGDFEFEPKETIDELAPSPQDSQVQETLIITAEPKRETLVGGYFFPPPEPGRPTAELVATAGPLQETRFSITRELFYIGRDEGNDLCIPEDLYASRKHAYLRYEKGSLFIFDRGSKSGTSVNQQTISPNTGLALEPGDQIKLGGTAFKVEAPHGSPN